jgi:hypothetical protein
MERAKHGTITKISNVAENNFLPERSAILARFSGNLSVVNARKG